MGGNFDPQQQRIIVETAKETSKWWIPILVAIITTIGGIIAVKVKKK